MRGVSVAVITPDGLALLCTGQGYTGHGLHQRQPRCDLDQGGHARQRG